MKIPDCRWLVIALFAIAAGAAEAAPDDCQERADRVVRQMEERGATTFSHGDRALAHSAALASCEEEREDAASGRSTEGAPTDPEDLGAMQRFWAGLVSLENKPVKKRHGKYRYVERE